MSRWIPRITSGGGGGGGGGPGDVQDHFAPKYIVGNVNAGDPAVAQIAPFIYVPDPGDGTGIDAAIAASAAVPGDIFIRPGSYLWAGANRMTAIPANRRVRGAGQGLTSVRNSIDDNCVFAMSTGATLGDMTITHSGTDALKGQALIEVNGVGCELHNIGLDLTAVTAGGRTIAAILLASESAVDIPTLLRKISALLPNGAMGAIGTWMAGIRGAAVTTERHIALLEDVHVNGGDVGLMTLGVEFELDACVIVRPFMYGLYGSAARISATGRATELALTKGGELAGAMGINGVYDFVNLRITAPGAQNIPAVAITGGAGIGRGKVFGCEIGTGFNPAIAIGTAAEVTRDVRVAFNEIASAAAAVPLNITAGADNTLVTGNISRGSGSVVPTNAGTGTQQLNNIWGA